MRRSHNSCPLFLFSSWEFSLQGSCGWVWERSAHVTTYSVWARTLSWTARHRWNRQATKQQVHRREEGLEETDGAEGGSSVGCKIHLVRVRTGELARGISTTGKSKRHFGNSSCYCEFTQKKSVFFLVYLFICETQILIIKHTVFFGAWQPLSCLRLSTIFVVRFHSTHLSFYSSHLVQVCVTYMASSDTRTLSHPSGGSLWNTYVLLGRGEEDGGSDIHRGGEAGGPTDPHITMSKHNTQTDRESLANYLVINTEPPIMHNVLSR